MITFELVKKLKDAGFPQGHTFMAVNFSIPNEFLNQIPVVPTLSELIEACGDRFHKLSKNNMSTRDKWLWMAESEVIDFEAKTHLLEGAPTPEEAVAQLWLEII